MSADTIKHMEFVQGVINRMANNSFLLKGWTVTLAAALFALAANDANPIFALIALFSSLAFWGLDAYYLRQERLFRKLYDDLRLIPNSPTETIPQFSLSTTKYRAHVPSWPMTLFSASILGLHGTVVGVVVVVFVISVLV